MGDFLKVFEEVERQGVTGSLSQTVVNPETAVSSQPKKPPVIESNRNRGKRTFLEVFEEVLGEEETEARLKKQAEAERIADEAAAAKGKENITKRSEFTRGLLRGIDQTQATFYGGVGMLSSAMGDDKASDMRFQQYREQMRQASENPATVDEFFSTDPKKGAFGSVGNLGTYVAGTMGSLLPTIAESAVAGLAGAAIGGAIVPAPDPTDVVAVPVGFIGGVLGRGAMKKAIAETAQRYVARGVAAEAAQQMGERAVKSALAKRIGATIGTSQITALQEGGGMYAEGREAGYDNPWSAILLGQVSGASEGVLGNVPFALRTFIGKTAVREAAQKLGTKEAAGLLWDAVKNAGEEAVQESFQEFLGDVNSRINDPNEKIFTKENFKQWAESGAAGALAGGILGGGGGASKAALDARRRQLEELRAKRFISKEEAENNGIEGSTRKEIMNNAEQELADLNEVDVLAKRESDLNFTRQQQAQAPQPQTGVQPEQMGAGSQVDKAGELVPQASQADQAWLDREFAERMGAQGGNVSTLPPTATATVPPVPPQPTVQPPQAPPVAQPPQPLYEVVGDENMVARVWPNPKGFLVNVADTDSGEVDTTATIFPTFEQAKQYADTILLPSQSQQPPGAPLTDREFAEQKAAEQGPVAPQVPVITSPEEHASLPMFGVYERNFQGQKRYGIKGSDRGGFGDSLFGSPQEAQAESDRRFASSKDQERKSDESKKKSEEDAKKKADYEASFGGFLSTDPKTKGRQLKVLGSLRQYNGKAITVKDLIEQKIAGGAVVNDFGGLESPDGAYLGSDKITKIGMDYARRLIANKAQPPTETKAAPQPESQPALEGKTEAFRSLPEKSRSKFESAWESNDPQAMKALLHSSNKVLRAEFGSRTGEKLPRTAKGTDEVIDRVYRSRVTGRKPTEKPVPPGMERVEDWKKAVDESIESDPVRASSIMRRVAQRTSSDAEAQEILDRLPDGFADRSNVGWDIVHNPKLSESIRRKAAEWYKTHGTGGNPDAVIDKNPSAKPTEQPVPPRPLAVESQPESQPATVPQTATDFDRELTDRVVGKVQDMYDTGNWSELGILGYVEDEADKEFGKLTTEIVESKSLQGEVRDRINSFDKKEFAKAIKAKLDEGKQKPSGKPDRKASIRKAIEEQGGFESNSADDVEAIRRKLHDGADTPTGTEIRAVMDEMKVEAGRKLESEQQKPTERNMPSYRDWRFTSTAKNSGKIVPNKVGVKFSPSQMQSIVKWAESEGYSVSNVTQTGIRVLDPSGNRLDIAMFGIAGVKDAESKAASKRRSEASQKADEERKTKADGRESASWITDTFGGVINDYNRNALSDYLEGATDKFDGSVSANWKDGLEKIGALSAEGKIDWKKVKDAYSASKSKPTEKPATEPTDAVTAPIEPPAPSKLLDELESIEELRAVLENWSADDKRPKNSYSLKELIDLARSRLQDFKLESGNELAEDLAGQNGEDAKKYAISQKNQIKAWIQVADREDTLQGLENDLAFSESFIKIVADDVSKIRKQDVYRLLSEVPSDRAGYFENWLSKRRPDLASDITTASNEILLERSKENQPESPAEQAQQSEGVDAALKALDAMLASEKPKEPPKPRSVRKEPEKTKQGQYVLSLMPGMAAEIDRQDFVRRYRDRALEPLRGWSSKEEDTEGIQATIDMLAPIYSEIFNDIYAGKRETIDDVYDSEPYKRILKLDDDAIAVGDALMIARLDEQIKAALQDYPKKETKRPTRKSQQTLKEAQSDMQAAHDAAQALMDKIRGKLMSGVDPEISAEVVRVAYLYTKAGIKTFKGYVEAIVEKFGDAFAREFAPYMQDGWTALNIRDLVSDPTGKVEDYLAKETKDERNDNPLPDDTGDMAKDETKPSKKPRKRRGSGGSSSGGKRRNTKSRRDDETTRDGSDADSGGNRDGVSSPAGSLDNHRIGERPVWLEGGAVTKLNRNIDSIETMQVVEQEGRRATPEEQLVIAQYTGWGHLKQFFIRDSDIFSLKAIEAKEWRSGAFDRLDQITEQRIREQAARKGRTESQILAKIQRELATNKHRVRLALSMTPAEYAQARKSTRYSHYTDPAIARSMWKFLESALPEAGKIRVLEPSEGSGMFWGTMPDSMFKRAEMHGIDMDTASSRVAKHLYPSVRHLNIPYQQSPYPEGFFDVAITNVPFNKNPVTDATEDLEDLSLHNYYFAKTAKRVREGGVVAFITTHFTMDAAVPKQREAISAQGLKFLGAVRLHQDAFGGIANTKVVTDIIIMQKVAPGLPNMDWNNGFNAPAKTSNVPYIGNPVGGANVFFHPYFTDKSNMIAGAITANGEMRGEGPELTVESEMTTEETAAFIDSALTNVKIDKEAFVAGESQRKEMTEESEGSATFIPEHLKDLELGRLEIDGSRLVLRTSEDTMIIVKSKFSPAMQVRAKKWFAIRDAMVNLRILQRRDDNPVDEINKARERLNKAYDDFVGKFDASEGERGDYEGYKPLNTPYNKSMFSSDFMSANILALENTRLEPTGELDKNGNEKKVLRVEKASVFRERNEWPIKHRPKPKTVLEALARSLFVKGGVDVGFIAESLGKQKSDIVTELEEYAFALPDSGGWEIKEVYLSGNIAQKLQIAEKAAEQDVAFTRNVNALKEVLPVRKSFDQLAIQINSPFMPEDVLQGFVARELGLGNFNVRKNSQELGGGWIAVYDKRNDSNQTTQDRDQYAVRSGTRLRRTGFDLLVDMMAGKPTIIVDEDMNGRMVPNAVLINLAKTKRADLSRAFDVYVRESQERMDYIAKAFNDRIGGYAKQNIPDWVVSLDGMADVWKDLVRSYQKVAIGKIALGGNTLLAHRVGYGKTLSGVAGIMEQIRLGVARKPIVVVPNHLTGQWAKSFADYYPSALIMAPLSTDFSKSKRQATMNRIMTGNWDAVIIPESSFKKLPMSSEYVQEFFQAQIAQAIAVIEQATADAGSDPRTIVELENIKERLENSMAKYLAESQKDPGPFFDEMGVDSLMVDEAHHYKNLPFYTQNTRIAGINPTGSQQAFDMLMKTDFINNLTGSRNVTFLTGTPIANSMTEAWVMMRYLMPEAMKDAGVFAFDDWKTTFGAVVDRTRVNTIGTGFRTESRFQEFVNIEALSKMFQQVADVQMKSNDVEVPPVSGGKPKTIVVPSSDAMKNFMLGLAARGENMPDDPSIDNMLNVMTVGAGAAIDFRLLDAAAMPPETSKLKVAADEVAKVYDLTTAFKGTQIIWSDRGVPKTAKKLTPEMKELGAWMRQEVESRPITMEEVKEKWKEIRPTKGAADELRRFMGMALQDMNFTEATDEDPDAYRVEVPDEPSVYLKDITDVDPNITEQAAPPWNVYQEMKSLLVAKGVPADQIVFIHDYKTAAQKVELFRKMNAGELRVLIGNTPRLGTGANIQERLVAAHHLDVPWRPADVEQRDGRIIRSGNRVFAWGGNKGYAELAGVLLDGVMINRYVTEGSIDARYWDTNEMKAQMLQDFWSESPGVSMEELGATTLSMAEVKAAAVANPLLREKIELETRLGRLEEEYRGALQSNAQTRGRLEEATKEVKDSKAGLQAARDHVAWFNEGKAALPKEEVFAIVVDGKTLYRRDDVAELLEAKLHEAGRNISTLELENNPSAWAKNNRTNNVNVVLGTVFGKPIAASVDAGFRNRETGEFVAANSYQESKIEKELRDGKWEKSYSDAVFRLGDLAGIRTLGNNPQGFLARIRNHAEPTEGLIKAHEKALKDNEKTLADLEKLVESLSKPDNSQILEAQAKLEEISNEIGDEGNDQITYWVATEELEKALGANALRDQLGRVDSSEALLGYVDHPDHGLLSVFNRSGNTRPPANNMVWLEGKKATIGYVLRDDKGAMGLPILKTPQGIGTIAHPEHGDLVVYDRKEGDVPQRGKVWVESLDGETNFGYQDKEKDVVMGVEMVRVSSFGGYPEGMKTVTDLRAAKSQVESDLDNGLRNPPETLYQTDPDIDATIRSKALDLGIAANEAGITDFEDFVKYSLKINGEKLTRYMGAYLAMVGKTVGMTGIRPVKAILGVPMTQEEYVQLAKQAFAGSPQVTPEQVEAGIEAAMLTGLPQMAVGFAPAGSPVTGQGLMQGSFDQPADYKFTESDYRPAVVSYARDKWGSEVAANGKPTWQNFVRWFDDSAVVDKDGNPLVVYHGGARTIDNDIVRTPFFYMTENRDEAQHRSPDATLHEFYVKMSKPHRVDEHLDNFMDFREYARGLKEDGDVEFAERLLESTGEALTLVETLKSTGNDGIIMLGEVDENYKNYLAFDPTQIKSATGNRGTFDPNNPNMLYQKGAAKTKITPFRKRGYLLERKVGNGKISFAAEVFDTFDDGKYEISWDMWADWPEEGDAPKGTGAATQMLLEILELAQAIRVNGNPIGYRSDSMLSTASHALHRRLSEAGVPFTYGPFQYVLSPEELMALPIDKIRSQLDANYASKRGDAPSTLMQEESQGGNVKGWTKFISGTRALIGATSKADISTVIHEFAHPIRRFLLDRKTPQDQRLDITDAEIEMLEKKSGAGSTIDGKWVTKWDVAAEEKFAKMWEQYFFEGKSPNTLLDSLFEKISRWMQQIYKTAMDITGGTLDPEVRKLFDKMVQRQLPADQRTDTRSRDEGTPSVPPQRQAMQQADDDNLTSVANAYALETRMILGLPGFADVTKETFQEWIDQALQILRKDPTYANRLVKELAQSNRNIDKIETAVLELHLRSLKNLSDAASDRLFTAVDAKDDVAAVQARRESDMLINEIEEITDVTNRVGTEQGRSLAARKIVLRSDFTRDGLRRTARVANAGKPLNEEQSKQIDELAKQIAKLEGDLAKETQKNDDLARQLAAKESIDDTQKQVGKPVRNTATNRAVKKVESFVNKFVNIFGKRDDTTTLQQTEDEAMAEDGEEVIKSFVEAGVYSFGEFMSKFKAVIKGDVPVAAKVALRKAWDKMKAQGDIPAPDMSNERQTAELRRLAKMVERNLVEFGITKPEEVIDGVHEALQEVFEDVTRREAMDAMSGYGQYSTPSQELSDKIIRDLNAQFQQMAKLDDMQQGIAPKKSGRGRDEPSPELRELIREVNEMKRNSKYFVTDPEAQLKTIFQATRTALMNRIYDLDKALKANEPIPGRTPNTFEGEQAEEIENLRKRRNELMADYKATFPKPGLTFEQRAAIAERAADRAITEIESQLATGDIAPKVRPEPISTPTLEAKRMRLEALRATRDATREMQKPKLTEEELAEREERRAEKAYVANLLNRIADYEDRKRQGYFGPKPKKEPRTLSPREIELSRQLVNLKDEFFRYAAEYRLKNMGRVERAWDNTKETMNLSRAIMTSFDLSAVFRQGGIASLAHPRLMGAAAREMWGALLGQDAEFDTMDKIEKDALYAFAMQCRLPITTDKGKIQRQEEAYAGRMVKYGIGNKGTKLNTWSKWLLNPVTASGRAYTTFLNSMRFRLFKYMVSNLGAGGAVTVDEGKVIASYISAATGRADLGKFNQAAANLNTVFFAPRYVASRFQYLAMPFYLLPSTKVSGRVKKMIAMEYARHAMGLAAFLGLSVALASLLTDDEEEKPTVEFDWRSSDFMKLKIGDTRIDPMAGLSQTVTLIGQMATGQKKGLRGDIKDLYGENRKFGDPDLWDVGTGFVRKKLAPIPGAIIDLRVGENVIGEKETALSAATDLFIPLSLSEAGETMQARGLAGGAIVTALSLLGMGGGTYGPKTQYATSNIAKREELFKKDLGSVKWNDPDLAYKDFLTTAQVDKFNKQREGRKQSLVFSAAADPKRKDYNSDETFKKSVEERDKALEAVVKAGMGPKETQLLLIAYYKRNYGSAYEVRGGVYQMKESLANRLRTIRRKLNEKKTPAK